MNIEEMKQFFDQNDVSHWYYVIDELGPGEVDGIGKIDGKWATYYSERGKKRNVHFFDDEDAACRAMVLLVSERVEAENGAPLPLV